MVTPICPQSLFARSIVFSPDNKLEISADPKARNHDLVVSFDGESVIDYEPDDIIRITKSEKYASFIRIKNENFFEILNKKLAGTEARV